MTNPTRDELIEIYNINISDDGTMTIARDDAFRLWNDGMTAALDAMRTYLEPPYYFSDDDTDYMRAISDQINTLSNFRCDDVDRDDDSFGLNEILNYIRPLNDLPDYTFEGFTYGYADFYSPISTLARMNLDEN